MSMENDSNYILKYIKEEELIDDWDEWAMADRTFNLIKFKTNLRLLKSENFITPKPDRRVASSSCYECGGPVRFGGLICSVECRDRRRDFAYSKRGVEECRDRRRDFTSPPAPN